MSEYSNKSSPRNTKKVAFKKDLSNGKIRLEKLQKKLQDITDTENSIKKEEKVVKKPPSRNTNIYKRSSLPTMGRITTLQEEDNEDE